MDRDSYWSGFCTAAAAVGLAATVAVHGTPARVVLGIVTGILALAAAMFSHDARRVPTNG